MIVETLFSEIPAVRYVAISQDGNIQLNQRPSVSQASDSESDKYEELLVNPAILQLATSRGEIDCGGMQYVLIRYGNFFQFIQRTPAGHISIAIEPDADLNSAVKRIREILTRAWSLESPDAPS